MKRVVIITPSLLTGGAETMAVRLATNIDKAKFLVSVICLSSRIGSALENELDKSGIETIYLGKNKSASLDTMTRIWKALSGIDPDIIHSHISGTIYATPWVMLHDCKMIHTIHTKPDMEFSEKFRKVLMFLTRINKVIIVAVSKENQKIAMRYYRLKEDKVRYVNNPVEITKYYKNNRHDNTVNFINVSRQDENKNQQLIIKAFSRLWRELPNIRLILVGNGTQHDNLIRQANELRVEKAIRFTGEISNVEDYLADADIYVSASHREGLPLSMIEAMAAKLPIISSEVGGVPDLIHENGILFADDDEDALLDGMRILAKNPGLCKQYGERSFELVQEFDVASCAHQYEVLYEEFSG